MGLHSVLKENYSMGSVVNTCGLVCISFVLCTYSVHNYRHRIAPWLIVICVSRMLALWVSKRMQTTVTQQCHVEVYQASG